MTIWLDPGHGGTDSGAVNQKEDLMEKDITLEICLETKIILEEKGIKVIITREKDENKTYLERAKLENDNPCDLALSVHLNGFKDESAEGFEVWISSKAQQIVTNLAELLIHEIDLVSPYKNRGIKKGYPGLPDEDFWVNRLTKSPSALLEIGFVTGKTEGRFVFDNYKKYANAISQGIFKFLGLENEKPKAYDFIISNLNEDNLNFLLETELKTGEEFLDFLKRQEYRFRIEEKY